MSFGENIRDLVDANSYGVISCAPAWSREPLGNVAQIINGFAFQSRFFRNEGGTPLIRIRNVVGGNTETFYDGPIPPGYWVEKGDLLVGMDGDFNCAHWDGDRSLLNQRVCRIDVDDRKLCRRFLGYLLPGYLQLINAATSSITVKHLSSRTLQQLPIPLPDRAAQRRIVARIDELFAEIEEGEQALSEARAGVETYRKALLKAAVTGELTADWRADSALGDLTSQLLSDALTLPSGWRWCVGREVSEFITKGTTPPKSNSNSAELARIPFIRVTNLSNDGSLSTEDLQFVREGVHNGFLSRSIVRPGDVLMNIVGPPLGQISIVPDSHGEWNINQAIARYRPTEQVLSSYLRLALLAQLPWLKARAKATSSQLNLTLELCREVPLPLPPRLEQGRIVEAYEEASTSVPVTDSLLAGTYELRQSILAAAFRGDLAA